MAAFGLRGKSILALLLVCLIAMMPAAAIGWLVLQGIHEHFADAYARNATLLSREKIRAPIFRELALSLRLADSEVTRQWLLDENDPAKRELFFREAEGYRRDFRDHAYFLGSAGSLGYYFNSNDEPPSQQARYILNQADEADRWFFSSLKATQNYNINVDYNRELNTTKVWLNVLVKDNAGRIIGLAGSGPDLSGFINDFVASEQTGVTPMIVDVNGAIQVHQNSSLIALNSGADEASGEDALLFSLLDDSEQAQRVRAAMTRAQESPGSVEILQANLNQSSQLLALTFIPELGWHVVNAIDLDSAQVIDSQWLLPLLAALAGLILMLVVLFAVAVERLLLRPLRQLKRSAQAMAAGRYDIALPPVRDDEIGELSTAFGTMADRVRRHTLELEQRVQERTSDLEQANQEMAIAQKKIGDSIDYASLIQRSILPDRELLNVLGEHHSVLWRPRDVVGGDFYVFHSESGRYFVGVVDCAGHGVPGALMTMLAHAALDQAITDCAMDDPAAVLTRADHIIRNMLGNSVDRKSLATNMDVGLAFINLDQRQVTFAGAKIALYFSDGEQVDHVAGGRRALGDKKIGEYHNRRIALGRNTFYLCTDGFLDQAGGDLGFGFGTSRFADMLRAHARLPLSEQNRAFSAALADYQGDYTQRDDITMLCFHFD